MVNYSESIHRDGYRMTRTGLCETATVECKYYNNGMCSYNFYCNKKAPWGDEAQIQIVYLSKILEIQKQILAELRARNK